MLRYGVSPEQLAKLSVLMSWQASQHPAAMTQRPHTLDEVLSARRIAPHLGLLECARRADGAGAAIVASSRFLERKGLVGRGNGGAGADVARARSSQGRFARPEGSIVSPGPSIAPPRPVSTLNRTDPPAGC